MEELIKALETIKAECEKHQMCNKHCPFIRIDSKGISCGVIYDVPSKWKIGEPEIITTILQ